MDAGFRMMWRRWRRRASQMKTRTRFRRRAYRRTKRRRSRDAHRRRTTPAVY
jgi:hypothetical protein